MLTQEDWVTSIESAADYIISEMGSEAIVDSVFERYGARGLWDLNPSYYTEVYSELHQVEADIV